MSKLSYLEVVQMLSKHQVGEIKARLVNLIARKTALAAENKDLDELIDELLKQLQTGEQLIRDAHGHD